MLKVIFKVDPKSVLEALDYVKLVGLLPYFWSAQNKNMTYICYCKIKHFISKVK